MKKKIERPLTGCGLFVISLGCLAYVDIVFDIVYLNGVSLTRYPLSERRDALHRIINPVERRFEIHKFTKADSVEDIETELRKIIAEGYTVREVFLLTPTGPKDWSSRYLSYYHQLNLLGSEQSLST